MVASVALAGVLGSLLVATDFAPTTAVAAPTATTVRADPPAMPSTIVLTTDRTTIAAGQTATLLATTDVTVTGTGSTIAIVDQTTGVTLKSCTTGTTCSVANGFQTGGAHTYVATVNALTSAEVMVSRTPWTISLTTTTSIFASNAAVTLTATASQSVSSTSSNYRIYIFDRTLGTLVKTCTTGSVCALTTTPPFLSGDAHVYVAMVAASGTPTYANVADVQATSNEIELSRKAWSATLVADKAEYATGQTVTLTSTANQPIPASGTVYRHYIFDATTGAVVKTCTSGSTCSVASSSLLAPGTPHDYVSLIAATGATVLSNASDIQATSNSVPVARKAWVATLTSNKEIFAAGDYFYLSVNTNQSLTASGYGAYIFDTVTGSKVGACFSSTGCTTSGGIYFTEGGPRPYKAFILPLGTYESLSDVAGAVAESNEMVIARKPWTLTLSVANPVFSTRDSPDLWAEANQRLAGSGYQLYVFDTTAGTMIGREVTNAGEGPNGNFLTGGPHTYIAVVGQHPTLTPSTPADVLNVQATSNEVSASRLPWQIVTQAAPYYSSTITVSNSRNQYSNLAYTSYLVDLTERRVISGEYNNGNFARVPDNDGHVYASYVASTIKDTWPLVDIQAVSDTVVATKDGGPNLPNEGTGGANPSENDCTCDHVDPIDSSSGEFYLPETDLAIPGIGPEVSVSRTYSTQKAASDSPFGYGWSTSLGMKLTTLIPGDVTDPLPRQVQITQENGSTVVFSQGFGHTYIAPDRVLATLTVDPITNVWTFTRKSSQVFTFDSAGALMTVADIHGNAVSFTRDTAGKVATVTASGSRSLTFTWTGSHITQVADSAGRTVAYAYSPAGDLTSVTAADGKVTTYVYSTVHLMLQFTRPGGATTTNTYDTAKRVLSQNDPVGRVTAFAYSGGVTTVTSPNGQQTVDTYVDGRLTSQKTAASSAVAATTTYVYDKQGNVTKVTDPLGNISTFTYDVYGNRLTSTDPLGRLSSWTYNQWRKPLTSTDPLGRVTTMTYDTVGNLLTATSPAGRVQSFTYNPNGTVATSTDAAGKVTSFTYDAAGRLATTTNPDSLVTSLTYNAAGQGTSVTSPDGAVASTVSDAAGRMLSVTDPLGRVTQFGYNAAGLRTSTTDALGNVTYAVFDAAGQQLSTTDAAGNITQYTYTPTGQLATVRDAHNNVTTLAYNARGELLSTTDAAGRVTSQTYDLAGRVISSTRPSGSTSTVVYDAAGQVSSSTNPGGFATTFTYNAAGKPLTITDALGRVTTTAYGLDGEVTSVTLPDSSVQSYGYDAAGRATSFTNADGKVTTYTYGNSGQLLSKTEPGGLTTTFAYSGGRLQSSTLPDATTASFTYDLAGNALTADRSSTPFVDSTFVYDVLNRATSVTDPTGTSSFTYDSRGNLLTEVNGGGDSLGYAYDSIGQLETITYPGSKEVDYEYDVVGQLTSVTDWLDNESTFTWTIDGQLETQTSGNGMVQSRDYDSRGQLTDTDVAGLTASLATFAYGFDAVGQLTSTETTLDGQDVDRDFEYDPLSQLSNVATTTGTTTTSEDYDATSAGLLTEIVGGRELTYNAAQQLVSIDAIVGPDIEFAYDSARRRTSSTHNTYGYDAAGYLATVDTPVTTVGYTTDARGLRQTRTEGTTTDAFLWSTVGGLPLLLDDGDHAYIYGPSSTPIAQIANDDTVEYLHTDLLGSVRLITDEDGDAVATATFDEFGNRVGHTGTSDSAFGFTGAWTDPDTGLVHLRARDYDPATGQFLTVDPAVDQTRQPYAYTGNNPLTRTDPAGLDYIAPDSAVGLSVTLAFGAQGERVVNELNAGRDVWTSINMGYNPVYTALERYDSFRAAGNDWWASGVMAFNPVYDVIAGLDKAFKATEQGCTAEAVEGYIQAAGGVVGTASIAAGGIGGLRGLTGSSTASAGAVSERTVVMGRDMTNRVVPYAETNGFATYAGTPKWIPFRNRRVDLYFNKRWINNEMKTGSRIVDIGEPAGMPPSAFYSMERQQVDGYWNYETDIQP